MNAPSAPSPQGGTVPLDGALVQTACAGQVVGRRVIALPQVESTNTAASQLAQAGEPSGTVIITEDQTAGRGRLGRSWHLRPGTGIACSVVLRPTLPADGLVRLNMAAAVAAVEACRSTGAMAQIKWPNDIVVGEHKLGGILCEAAIRGTGIQFVIVGIGLNVNDDVARVFAQPSALRTTATSLRLVAGQPVDRMAVLLRLLRELDSLVGTDDHDPQALASAWAMRSATVGRLVSIHDVTTGAAVAQGRAIRLDLDGALVVRLADGALRRFSYGDITIRHRDEAEDSGSREAPGHPHPR